MGNDTQRRVELCLKAYVAGAVVGAACGIAGYLNVAGLGEGVFLHAGRASGTFKDPNVLGSFLVLPIVYLAQSLMLGTARNAIVTGFLLLVCFLGMFLSLSRGSYGATLIAFILLTSAVFVSTPNSATRRRIVIATLATVALAAVIVAALLSIPETREFFQQRTAVTQDYDEGSTGRFGNQLRAIPMLLDRFMGFGPLRFRLNFGLEPHNSYVGAFANNGWIGGLLFLLIVGVTTYIGLRLMFTSSPFQRQAQVAASALMALFAQGLQIDIDHWRFVFFMLGAVWGLEAGRQRWLAQPRLRLNPPSRPAEEASFRFEPADAPTPRRDNGPYGCASP
jgi:O-antigen ligase